MASPSSGSLDAPVKVSVQDGFSRLLQQQENMAVMQSHMLRQLAELHSDLERLFVRWSTIASDEVSSSPPLIPSTVTSSASSSVSSSLPSIPSAVTSSAPIISVKPLPAHGESVLMMVALPVKAATNTAEPLLLVELAKTHGGAIVAHNHRHLVVRSLSKRQVEAEQPPAEPPPRVVNLEEEPGILPNPPPAAKLACDSGKSTAPVLDDSTKSDAVFVVDSSVFSVDSIGRVRIENIGEKFLVVKDVNGDVFHLKFAKLHLIPFSDENPRSWLRTCVSFLLGGRAIKWFTGFLADKGVPWKEFGEQFVVGFHYVCEDFLSQMLLGFQFTGDCGCTSSYYAAPVLPIKIGANKWKRELAVGGWIYLQQTSVHMRSSLQLCKQIGEAW
ncbi:hypothetical protein Tsubulata_046565, partial [Turnera subulata]